MYPLCSYCGNSGFCWGGYDQTLVCETAVSWLTLPSTEALMIIPGPGPSGSCKSDREDLLTGTTAASCPSLSKHLSSDNIVSSELRQVTTSLFSVFRSEHLQNQNHSRLFNAEDFNITRVHADGSFLL